MIVRAFTVLWFMVVWVALWEDWSPGNALTGLALGVLVVGMFTVDRTAGPAFRFRPLRFAAFVAYFTWKVLEANVVVTLQVLRPRRRTREAIVSVPVTDTSDTVLAILSNAISLTPGTLIIEIDHDPAVLYIHVLHLESIAQVRYNIFRLERYVIKAVGTQACLDDLERRMSTLKATMTPTEADRPGGDA